MPALHWAVKQRQRRRAGLGTNPRQMRPRATGAMGIWDRWWAQRGRGGAPRTPSGAHSEIIVWILSETAREVVQGLSNVGAVNAERLLTHGERASRAARLRRSGRSTAVHRVSSPLRHRACGICICNRRSGCPKLDRVLLGGNVHAYGGPTDSWHCFQFPDIRGNRAAGTLNSLNVARSAAAVVCHGGTTALCLDAWRREKNRNPL